MDMEKIERAFGWLTENVSALEKALDTDFYDALVEQNAAYLEFCQAGQTKLAEDLPVEILSALTENNSQINQLNLTAQEWQKLFQFVLLKGSQVAPLQPNHAFTPDAIGVLFQFILENLQAQSDAKSGLRALEFGSGTGNLAEFLLANSSALTEYVGFEIDDLLLDLAASMSEIIGSKAEFMQVDAVQTRLMEPVDVVLADLPVGFYPDNEVAQHFEVANKSGHTFAHQLMIEQSFRYLKDGAFAIFLAPEDLLTTSQGPLLKNWISTHGSIMAILALPDSLFNTEPKAIYIFKKGPAKHQTFVYPLTSLTNAEVLQEFMSEFKKNVKL